MEVTKQDRNLFKGLVIGSLVGAAVGIVFAPRSGRELRSDIKGEGEEAIREAKRFYSGTRAKADAVFESAKDMFGGRERSEGLIFQDLEEPDEFTAAA
jgi:gas vesicle protein